MTQSASSRWKQPGFIVAVVILAVAAVGLNAAVNTLQLHFKKLPVALRHDLPTIPVDLGTWVQVTHDEPLPKDVQEALATDHYIFRSYVDRTKVSPSVLAGFEGLTPQQRSERFARLQLEHPDACITMAVTFYTGLVDTVAHIPDRCYIADGFEPSSYTTPKWDIGPNRLGKGPTDDPRIEVRFIGFEDQTAAARVTRRVAYFFHTQGHYESDPLAVRKRLQDLFKRHGYYAKVELMTQIKDADKCQVVMADFLRSALPQVERCLPDWAAVENGKPAEPAKPSIASTGRSSLISRGRA